MKLIPLFIFLTYIAIIIVVGQFVSLEEVLITVGSYGIWAPLLFILLLFIGGFLYFPNGVFLISSAIIFPPFIGGIYYMIGILISATSSFYVGQHLHEKDFFPSLKKKILESDIKKKIDAHGYKAIFITQLLGLSFDLPNYAAGYVKLKYPKFFLVVFATNIGVTYAFHTIYYFGLFTRVFG